MPLCQLDGVLHLSPEKRTNNEPFWHQKNHWISGELVRVLFQRDKAVAVVQIVQSGAKWRATAPVILLQIGMSSPQGLILWKIMSPCPELLSPSLKRVHGSFVTTQLIWRLTPTLWITVYRNKSMLRLLSGTTNTKRNTHVWVVKQQSQEQPQKSHKQDFYKNIFWSNNRSLRPEGPNPKLFFVFGNFYASGTQVVWGKRITATPSLSFLPT